MLESIEYFVICLKCYTETTPTHAVDEMVVTLMVELITTLSLMTEKLKKRQSRESFRADVLPCSACYSQTDKEFFRGQGHQCGTAEA